GRVARDQHRDDARRKAALADRRGRPGGLRGPAVRGDATLDRREATKADARRSNRILLMGTSRGRPLAAPSVTPYTRWQKRRGRRFARSRRPRPQNSKTSIMIPQFHGRGNDGRATDAAAEYEQQRLADGAACLDRALHYRRVLGWSVLALCPPDHVGVKLVSRQHAKTCKTHGKRHWHTWKEFEERLPTEEEIRDWWRQLPTSNLGLALGPVSGVVRLDIEGRAAARQLQELSAGDLPDTLEFRSGRRDGTGRGIL